ncbi:hypothetical protein E4U21_005622 [Claviceps maximensis]|nr:hypothetical protein E4U21_005622 [Claviceps maximensis]
MKSMKGLSMNKVLGSIRKRAGGSVSMSAAASAANPAENPEITAHNSVKAFCESGGKSKTDEVLFLPPIVDAAESSPAAAAECARVIRKFLSKDYTSKPSWQYNAMMLVRILTENPGETFTRNLDDKFVDTIRTLLKSVKDRGVWQILMETLDDFEYTKMNDQNLAPLILMWKKEKEAALSKHGSVRGPPIPQRPNMNMMMGPPPQLNRFSQSYFDKSHTNIRLPDAVELASRLEEARTSAKLLEQVVMNTPADEMLQSELIKEFADRCLSASRSLQGYMVLENPAPDNDTMESLIDTNEQLQTALNQHQRAVLNARKQLGLGTRHSEDDSPAAQSDHSDNDGQQRLIGAARSDAMADDMCTGALGGGGKGKQTESYKVTGSNGLVAASSSRHSPKDEGTEDPFADPCPADASKTELNPASTFQPQYPHEPFHPGFSDLHQSEEAGLGNGPGRSSVYGGLSKLQTPHDSRRTVPKDDDDDDDDIYAASPNSKGPLSK